MLKGTRKNVGAGISNSTVEVLYGSRSIKRRISSASDWAPEFNDIIANVLPATGGTIIVPDGTGTMPFLQAVNCNKARLKIIVGAGNTLLKNFTSGSAATDTLFAVTAGNCKLDGDGATLLSTFDYNNNGNATTPATGGAGYVATESLIRIGKDAANTTIEDVSISGFTLSNARRFAIYAGLGGFDSQFLRGLTLRDLTVTMCYWGIQLQCLDISRVVAGLNELSDVTLENVKVRKTWNPTGVAAGTDSTKGGNAFQSAGVASKLWIKRFDSDATIGRMAIEIHGDSSGAATGTYPKGCEVQLCTLAQARYRDLSIVAQQSEVHNNTITDATSYVELWGAGLKFYANVLINTGIFASPGQSTSYAQRNGKTPTDIFHNSIFDPKATNAIAISQAGYVSAHNNNIYLTAANSNTAPLLYMLHSYQCDMTTNHIFAFGASTENRAPWRLHNLVSCRFEHNTVQYGEGCARPTNGQSLFALGGGLYDVAVRHNRVNSEIAQSFDYTGSGLDAAGISYLHLRTYASASSTWADVDITLARFLNAPPSAGSATNGVPYLIGDTPTGAWAGNPLRLATTADAGTTWSYSDFKGIAYRRNAAEGWLGVDASLNAVNPHTLPHPWFAGDPPSSPAPANGDQWLEITGGITYCTFEDNQLNINGQIKPSWELWGFDAATAGAVFQSRFWANDGAPAARRNLRALQFDVRPRRTAPSTKTYAATLAIDAYATPHVVLSAMTGAMTVSAPTNALRGMELTIELLAAAGAGTITWNAVFKGSPTASAGTAGQKCCITFRHDGAAWVKRADSGWY